MANFVFRFLGFYRSVYFHLRFSFSHHTGTPDNLGLMSLPYCAIQSGSNIFASFPQLIMSHEFLQQTQFVTSVVKATQDHPAFAGSYHIFIAPHIGEGSHAFPFTSSYHKQQQANPWRFPRRLLLSTRHSPHFIIRILQQLVLSFSSPDT